MRCHWSWGISLLCVILGMLLQTSAAVPAPVGAVSIARTGEGFSIASPVYRATISAKTGLLEQMSIDGCTVIDKTGIDLADRPLGKAEVVQEGPAKVVAYLSARRTRAVTRSSRRPCASATKPRTRARCW